VKKKITFSLISGFKVLISQNFEEQICLLSRKVYDLNSFLE